MIDEIISIIGIYFSTGLNEWYFISIIALAFTACVPNIIRYILEWR